MKNFYLLYLITLLSFPLFAQTVAQKVESKDELTSEEKEAIEVAREVHRKVQASLPCKPESSPVEQAKKLTNDAGDAMCPKENRLNVDQKKMKEESEKAWKNFCEAFKNVKIVDRYGIAGLDFIKEFENRKFERKELGLTEEKKLQFDLDTERHLLKGTKIIPKEPSEK